MKIKTFVPVLTLLLLFCATSAHASAQQAASEGNYEIQNIWYEGRSANAISFRDEAGASVIVLMPANQMATVLDVVQTYHFQPFNFRLQITTPYTARTQGCTGTFISYTLVRDPNGSGSVALASNVARNGNCTVRNVRYLSHTATTISFSDSQGNSIIATVPRHQLIEILNPLQANRARDFDLTLNITQPFNAGSRECRGGYRGSSFSRDTGGQQSSSSSSRANANSSTLATLDGAVRNTDYTLQNLAFSRLTETKIFFRDTANATAKIQFSAEAHRNLTALIRENPYRMYNISVRITRPFDAARQDCLADYRSHTVASGMAYQSRSINERRSATDLSKVTSLEEYMFVSLTYVSASAGRRSYTLSDRYGNTIILSVPDARQSDDFWDRINEHPNKRANPTVQITHPYNQFTKQCRGTYIAPQ